MNNNTACAIMCAVSSFVADSEQGRWGEDKDDTNDDTACAVLSFVASSEQGQGWVE
jgi:hypothetical protein